MLQEMRWRLVVQEARTVVVEMEETVVPLRAVQAEQRVLRRLT
jgi:hypothetical protein